MRWSAPARRQDRSSIGGSARTQARQQPRRGPVQQVVDLGKSRHGPIVGIGHLVWRVDAAPRQLQCHLRRRRGGLESTNLSQVAAVGDQDQIKLMKISHADLTCAQSINGCTAFARHLARARVGGLTDVVILGAGGIEVQIQAEGLGASPGNTLGGGTAADIAAADKQDVIHLSSLRKPACRRQWTRSRTRPNLAPLRCKRMQLMDPGQSPGRPWRCAYSRIKPAAISEGGHFFPQRTQRTRKFQRLVG